MSGTQLPADYAIDALSLEAQRRGKALGRPYSYGQLIADTNREQRERISDEYKSSVGCRASGKMTVPGAEADRRAVENVRRKHKEEMAGD